MVSRAIWFDTQQLNMCSCNFSEIVRYKDMKGKQYKCECCEIETNKARVVNSGNLLCNFCNIKLLKFGVLYFTADTGLRIKEKKGDFYIVEGFKEIKSDFWESRRQAREHAEMDNQSMVELDCHESY